MRALMIIDMQNDFMAGGPLAIAKADTLLPIINQLIPLFPYVITSQDWHPKDHVSFAASHSGKRAGDVISIGELDQILWPTHCVRDTKGAELVSSLHQERISSRFYKGTQRNFDSYSAFFDQTRRRSTGLDEYLKKHGIDDLFFVGVATEYCVLNSALDALDLGFEVHVIVDACRAINRDPADESRALETIVKKGGHLTCSQNVTSEKKCQA